MKHVIDAYTLALFPRRSRPESDAIETRSARARLGDDELTLSVAGIAHRAVSALESLAGGLRRRAATLARARSLRQGPAPFEHGRPC